MPIVDIEKSKQLEFGYGDIEVAPGLLQTEDVIGAVNFWNNDGGREIGDYQEYEPGHTVCIEETPVRMIFNRVESIDVVIDVLEQTKKMMLEKK